MTTVLYVLAVLTPLLLAGMSLAMIWVRSIERRAEDRVRAEHGLPPRPPRPARRIEDAEAREATVRGLRRRVATALEPEVTGAAPRSTRSRDAVPAARLPWPLEDLAGGPEAPTPGAGEIRITRTPRAAAVPAPAPPAPAPPVPVPTAASPDAPRPAGVLPPPPERDADGARAVLARAAATLQELERAADQADRHGTKDCPECAKSVRVSARVCPHCRHRMAPEPEQRDVTAA